MLRGIVSLVEQDLFEWTNSRLTLSQNLEVLSISPLRQEASAREYFRVNTKENSFVGVFCPPETESIEQFIFLAEFLKDNGVTVPEVISSDTKLGFMLVEDFGDKLYQLHINRQNYHHLYSAAIDEMIRIHLCPPHPKLTSLSRNEMYMQMDIFRDWFLKDLLDIEITAERNELIENVFGTILDDLITQPQVLCHFDFESRNLMMLENGSTGVLDFQDAVFGPIFLDPVSLLKDLYFKMSEKEMCELLDIYTSKAYEFGLMGNFKTSGIKKSFDFTALQRQLRIMGTLSRLHLRDKKPFRLPDLTTTLDFAINISARYDELRNFSVFLKKIIFPELKKTLKEIL